MSYALGVDIGTSFVTTAIARPGRGDADPPSVHDAARFSSALFQDADGGMHHGEAAEWRGRSEPERLVRSVVDRIGDDVAVAIGDRRHTAERLYASIARQAVDRITAGEGSAPSSVRLVVPVRWGAHRIRLVRDALVEVGIADATFVSGFDAVIAASDGLDRTDGPVAVYDLSSRRCVVTIRRGGDTGAGPLVVDGIENLGGGDVDDAVLRHAVASAHELFAGFDSGSADAVDALSLLRDECVRVKEAIDSATELPIAVRLPTGAVDVVLDRTALDRIAEPTVRETIAVFRRAMLSARIDAAELEGIVIVGGSASLAVVARMLSEEFGRPIMSRDRPEATAACGAALEAVATIEHMTVAPDEESAGDPPPHPIRLARLRRGAAIGSHAIRRGAGAVAAAMAAIVGAEAASDGDHSIGSDSPGSAG